MVVRTGSSTGPEVRRALAVLIVDKETESVRLTAMTGYSLTHAFTLRRRYLQIGIATVQDKRKGKPKELLTKKQREEIVEYVKTTRPTDHGYNSEYWTTGILGVFIEKRYSVKYKSKTSYYLLFKGAKFTFHKPGRVYERRDEAEVQKWRKTTKIRITQVLRD